jgi:hypothetical protein
LEGIPQFRDVVSEGLQTAVGRFLAPDIFNENIGRADPSGVDEEVGEEGALFRRGDLNRTPPVHDFQWTQNPEFHVTPLLPISVHSRVGPV